MPADWIKTKELKETRAKLADEAEGIVKKASTENRRLNDAEKARFGEIENEQGRIGELLDNADKLADWGNNSNPRQLGRDRQPGSDAAELPRAKSIVIPAQARYRHSALKAYKGENADERAYIAGQFLAGTLFKNERSAQWCKDHGIDVTFKNAASETSGPLGGYLVPIEMEQAIVDLRERYGIFRQYAKVTPMASDTKLQPRRTGGLTAYFLADNQAITDSDKAWDSINLIAKKLGCLAKYSSELNEDAILNIADDLTSEIAYAFAVKEDQCGLVGDGSSTYGHITGVTNALAAGSIVTAATGHTGFETLTFADFESCIGKLPLYPGIQPAWFISKVGWAASMLRLMDAGGGNTVATLQAGPTGYNFLGFPVVLTQVLNGTLGADVSKFKALYGDLSMAATLGNRRGMSIMLSEHAYFSADQLAIRGTERFDINVHESGSASAAGAIIGLKSAAS